MHSESNRTYIVLRTPIYHILIPSAFARVLISCNERIDATSSGEGTERRLQKKTGRRLNKKGCYEATLWRRHTDSYAGIAEISTHTNRLSTIQARNATPFGSACHNDW